MNLFNRLLLLSLMMVNMAILQADTLYRSVNEKGEIVYSSKPIEGAREVTPVDIQPAPSRTAIDEAKKRAKTLQRAAESGQSRRDHRQREAKSQSDDSARTLAEAEKRLEQAKIIKESDWQVLAKGGRHLNEAYFERVRKAEAALAAVKKGL